MMVEIEMPDYISREYATVSPRCYQISDGPYTGKHVAVVPMLATFAIMIMDREQWYTRWCYTDRQTAIIALDTWDGRFDPPGDWVKQKPEERHGPGSPLALRDA